MVPIFNKLVKLGFPRPLSTSTPVFNSQAGSPQADLYFGVFSPPSRAVEMVANLVGVRLNKRFIDLQAGEQYRSEYAAINPRRKVPFYVDQDVRINESRAICAYLANKFLPPNNTLYPHDPIRRAQVDELLFLDMGALYDSSWRYYGLRILRGAKEVDEVAARDLKNILKYLDNRLQTNGSNKFLTGDDLTIADISIAASLSFPDTCGYDLSQFPLLLQYYSRLKESIPKFDEINAEGLEIMRSMARKVLKVNQSV